MGEQTGMGIQGEANCISQSKEQKIHLQTYGLLFLSDILTAEMKTSWSQKCDRAVPKNTST